MKRVVIIGAGGHAREVAEILRHQERQGDDVRVLGFVVVVDPENHGATVGQWPVMGTGRGSMKSTAASWRSSAPSGCRGRVSVWPNGPGHYHLPPDDLRRLYTKWGD
jgi:hypothetical protein